jgi:hypothetical protein
MSIEVEAGFMLDLGSKLDQMNGHLKRLTHKPIYKPVGGSVLVSAGATAPVLLRLEQSPSRGRVWNILKIGVFGADPHTPVAQVQVDVYAGYLPGQIPYVPSMQDAILSGVAVPSITPFSTEVEWCESGEEIFALLYGTGVVPGVQFAMVARVGEYNVPAVEAMRAP